MKKKLLIFLGYMVFNILISIYMNTVYGQDTIVKQEPSIVLDTQLLPVNALFAVDYKGSLELSVANNCTIGFSGHYKTSEGRLPQEYSGNQFMYGSTSSTNRAIGVSMLTKYYLLGNHKCTGL